MNQQQAIQQNSGLRAALLATAPRGRKNLGTFTSTAVGTSTRIKLYNVGVLTSLQLEVTVPVTIGTATGVASAKAPYNVISRVRVTDFDGTDRVNLSGFQLFILNCIRARIPVGYNNSGPIIDANGSTVKGGIVAASGGSATGLPNVPLSVGSANIVYVIDVPLAYDEENDLRGAILAQTAVGEMYLTIDWASSLYTNNDVDSVYAGAGTTTVALGAAGFQCKVYQKYLLPQPLPGSSRPPLPMLDLMTVYELNGTIKSSDNIANNTEKLVPYPNYRTVIGVFANFVDGSVLSSVDVSQLRIIANGNNVLQDYDLTTKLFEQRNFVNGDLAKGVYWFLHRNKPVETALFGNVQLGLTPTGIAGSGNIYWELGFESFYTKGSALPGLAQASG